MKKVISIIAVFTAFLFTGNRLSAQATKYVNFGGVGTGLYAGLELPVSPEITVQPFAATDWNIDYLILGAKGNYYFDDLLELPNEWDVYGGANVGFGIDNVGNDDNVSIGLQIGGRWFWNEKWAINAEFGGGTFIIGGLGVTLNL